MKKEIKKVLQFKFVRETRVNSKVKFVVISNPPQWHEYKKHKSDMSKKSKKIDTF